MTFVVCSAVLLFFCASTQAQLSKFDKSTLIDGLREEGMRELLKHFAETELQGDPVLQKQVLLSQYMLDYEAFLAANDVQGAIESFAKGVETSRQLIKEHYNHEQRFIWQTQLAEALLLEGLGAIHRNADRFYEFGVPTEDQAEAYRTASVEALELLADADARFFVLEAELPKEPDHTEKRVDTGLWNRMKVEFYGVRTPYLYAHALYYVWLLPDSNSYFQTIGSNKVIPHQGKTIPEERSRMLRLAQQHLETLLNGPNAASWSIIAPCQSLLGRVFTAQGKPADGIGFLDKAVAAKTADLQDLWAHLGLAFAHAAAGRTTEALALLKDDMSHPMATANLLLKLLVTDARHRVMLAVANKKPAAERGQAVAEAYRPYLDLIADPALGESAEGLREYIHQRWVSSVDPKTDLAQLPAVVVAAMGRVLRIDGQNMSIQGAQQEDPDTVKEGHEKLTRALKVNTDLLARKDLLDGVRADAMFNQAVAMYFLNQEDVSKILEAANIMVDIADRFPDQAVAKEAIASAVAGVLHPLHTMSTPVAGVPEAYRRAVDVLLSRFPALPVAANERYYFAVRVLIPSGEIDKAIDVLSGVPSSHVNYFEAQRELLYARLAKLKKTGSADDRKQLDAAAKVLESQAAAAATGEQAAVALNTAGHARLLQVDLAAMDAQPDTAIHLLDDFEQTYATDPELVRESLGRRIGLLARAGRYDQVGVEAEKMMKGYPNDAAPIIDAVLTELDTMSTELRRELADELVDRKREALQKQIAGYATTARTLAQLLVGWASGEGFTRDQMVPYRLLLARSMRLEGKADEALAVVRPLIQDYPDDADVMHETAETLFAVGTKDAMIEAGSLYSALIQGLAADESGKYPPRYFNAWMRFFQIREKMNEGTQDIALTIRQLEMTDPNLGGEPYKSEMIRMRGKFER